MPDVENDFTPMNTMGHVLGAVEGLLRSIDPLLETHSAMWKSRTARDPRDILEHEKAYSAALGALHKATESVQQHLARAKSDLKELQTFRTSLTRQSERFAEIQQTLHGVLEERATPLRAELKTLEGALRLCAIAKIS